jgi:hypothetical protein
MVRAYSSVVEHYVDIVGVASSILATPTIAKQTPPMAGFFVDMVLPVKRERSPPPLSSGYLPCQFGLRFSANAAEPSRASWLAKMEFV